MKKNNLLIILIISILLIAGNGCLNGSEREMYKTNYKKLIAAFDPAIGGWHNYNDSDIAAITDKVATKTYHADIKKTELTFKSNPNAHSIWLSASVKENPSDGDLTKYYKVGEVINFKVHIINVDGSFCETIQEWYP